MDIDDFLERRNGPSGRPRSSKDGVRFSVVLCVIRAGDAGNGRNKDGAYASGVNEEAASRKSR
jgi:hypothetical protein